MFGSNGSTGSEWVSKRVSRAVQPATAFPCATRRGGLKDHVILRNRLAARAHPRAPVRRPGWRLTAVRSAIFGSRCRSDAIGMGSPACHTAHLRPQPIVTHFTNDSCRGLNGASRPTRGHVRDSDSRTRSARADQPLLRAKPRCPPCKSRSPGRTRAGS